MKPQGNQEPGYDLPAPAPEAAHLMPTETPEIIAPIDPAGELPQQAELPQAPPTLPAPLPVSNDPVSTDGMLAASPLSPASTTTAPPIAEDADLIEKEWVERAKAIVEQTKEDPHKQNKEMAQFKADYIRKRYNKEVPIDG